MGRKKKACDNEEIANFIENVTERFQGQRNTLNFMKKLGNVDAGQVIVSAAEKEIDFVTERLKTLQKIEMEEESISEETTSYVASFVAEIYGQVLEDVDGILQLDETAMQDLTAIYETLKS